MDHGGAEAEKAALNRKIGPLLSLYPTLVIKLLPRSPEGSSDQAGKRRVESDLSPPLASKRARSTFTCSFIGLLAVLLAEQIRN